MAPRSPLHLGSLLLVALALACEHPAPPTAPLALSRIGASRRSGGVQHVLLISVDGFHQVDLARYVATHPRSTLAALSRRGTTFTKASASKPSDSFPGLLALITGGSPRSTGVFYDVSYDRSLSPPGSACKTLGTTVTYDESIDLNSTRSDGGGGLDATMLPLDPAHGCTPVFPHQYLRVNTIFEVIKAAGGRTAWTDKHLSYEFVNGPSGHGVDDLFTPEITAVLSNGETAESNAPDAQGYDAIKVQATLNQIDGKDHTGEHAVGVPAIFGMNFQAVSVGQKTAGYEDAAGRPTPALASSLDFVDAALGSFVAELERQHLLSTTAIIISAKHGQTPINRALRRIVDDGLFGTVVNGVASNLLAQETADDIGLLWLTDQSKSPAVATALLAHSSDLGLGSAVPGSDLPSLFNDPSTDPRTPDVFALPVAGVIYTSPTATKLAEHGGFHEEDTHVAMLVVLPHRSQSSDEESRGAVITTPVRTAQVAPTILALLGLDPSALAAVQQEGTEQLPLPASE